MTNILIAGYYGLGNIGDEAILAGMIASLRKYIDDPHISVLTNNPEETRLLHNVLPIEQSFKKGIPAFGKNLVINGELKNLIHEIDKCDIFILGGGSLLQDLRIYYLPVLLSLVKMAQRTGKKTVIYGIGAGPIDTYLGQKLCRSVLNKADLVTVRDTMSKGVLEKCKVRDVILTADPAFGIELPPQNSLDPYLRQMNIQTDGARYISCTAYNWLRDSDLTKNAAHSSCNLDSRRRQMAEILGSLVDKADRKMVFVPTVRIDAQGYKAIKDFMPAGKAQVLEYNAHFNAVFAALYDTEVLIGMRLHSMILATIMGVPVVPVSYCGKVKSYLEQIGLADMYLDVENLGTPDFAEQLSSHFSTIWTNRSLYAAKQRNAAENLYKNALLNAKLVAELI